MDDILQVEHATLRKVADEVPIEDITKKQTQDIIKKMSDILKTQEDGVALAAPQINIQKRIFIISRKVWDIEEIEKEGAPMKDMVFINPVITKKAKRLKTMEEGCLSVRWKYGEVKRSVTATVRAYDENGKVFTYTGKGLLAQIFQHETDHLDGVLFTDKARKLRDIDPEEIKQLYARK